ncbi:hypothetical protein NP493_154g04020 [Ridgeia piscesae]|uniref:3CxxC-type domain-containing protein n=1 Tax=Ridgeia piscesae TaxID=27915 RepID=A0AAD9P449_RIDPI|nr:hypothetical protein NP493_154g04020 [Ridgeia piscesae]
MSNLRRMYGYFRCNKCNHGWESSQVYCRPGTETAAYKQGCSTCKTELFPYRVESPLLALWRDRLRL